MMQSTIIEVYQLRTQFGPWVIHDNLNLHVKSGEILGLIGGSGTGKSTLLREMIRLEQPAAGTIHLFGQNIFTLNTQQVRELRKKCGVMFQQGALFSALTVAENIALPLQTYTVLNTRLIAEIVAFKMTLVGLSLTVAHRYPAQLSGGMIKRVAVARALALDPSLLFLDEPTAGLDPIGAAALDELILQLKQTLGLTVVMVTHDVDSLWRITDRVAVLADKQVFAIAPVENLLSQSHPWIQSYFQGPRGRAAQRSHQRSEYGRQS